MKALKLFEQEFQEKAIDVQSELADNLPLIPADEKLLKRALCNLIKNSIEAMVGENRVLRIVSRLSEGRIEILVSDTGKGIPAEELKKIFDPFVTSKIYGPGLGLTFIYKIIQDHNGTISVESEPGKGTTFTISFPVEKP